MANEGLVPSLEDEEKRRVVISKLQKVHSNSIMFLFYINFVS